MAEESVRFALRSIDGKHDAKELKRELDTLRGVRSVSVNVQSNTLSVDYDSSGVTRDRLQKRLEQLGYCVERVSAQEEQESV